MIPIAFDTETNGLYPHSGDRLFAYSTCDWFGETDVRRIDGSAVRKKKNSNHLKRMAKSKNFFPICHNSKFDLTFLEKFLKEHIAEKIPFHDTIIQAHILMNNHPSKRLKDLAWELAGIPKDDETAIKKFLTAGGDYSNVPENLMEEYQEDDAGRTMVLHQFFYPKIKKNPSFLDIYKMEIDLIRTTMRMEERGMMISRKENKKLIESLNVECENCLLGLNEISGTRINPRSADQIRKLLYEQLRMPVLDYTKKMKEPSTSKLTLSLLREKFPHPVLDLIEKYRSYSRGISMLESYDVFADSEGIIHPSINTCGADTSRESCSNPNLQNVQKTEVLLNPFPIPARRVFRPRPGFVNFHIDYSGIEMRLLIHYTKDEVLVKICNDGGDVHEPAAIIFYGDRFLNAKGSKRKELRGAAKNMNFAIPYGASGLKVGKGLGLSASEGLSRLLVYKTEFPGLANFTPEIIRVVKSQSFVETIFGRHLFVPHQKAYMGTNYLIQGTAAGILKRAQNRVHSLLKEITGGEVKILLPIHDEIVLEYPRNMLSEAKHVLRKVRKVMIDFPQFNIPLEVDFEVATLNWERKKPFSIFD